MPDQADHLPTPAPTPAPARLLEFALLFTLLAHAAGMLAMAAFLLPGVPGGGTPDVALRAAHIADHPWLWRLGWLPWQLTAASDLLLSFALLRTRWVPRLPAVLAALATTLAVLPDQFAQASWTWHGVDLARRAVDPSGLAAYLAYETRTFRLTAGFGPIGYIAGALAWSWCFAAAGVASPRVTILGLITWLVFAAATAAVFLPEPLRSSPALTASVALGNALAFLLLMLWIACISEAVLRRARPDAAHGDDAPWRSPRTGPAARLLNLLANSRLARALVGLIPTVQMSSDITSVVYVNYLLDADRLAHLVTPPLALQRLGPDGRHALFTFLTFRHGRFGPTFFGPLRRLWPSPIQSNWRIHVVHPATGVRGVQFLSTAITSTGHALCARLLTRGVPMHLPAHASLDAPPDGPLRLELDPGAGSAPDARAELTPCDAPDLPEPWRLCFGSWRQFLAYCVPQERAMSAFAGRVLRQEISLDIPLDACRPLAGRVHSRAASTLAGDTQPLCFAVDRVHFRFLREATDRPPPPPPPRTSSAPA